MSQTLHVRSYDPVINLSPDLLKAQFVSGNRWALSTLKRPNYCCMFSICFSISSTFKNIREACLNSLTVNQLFQLWFSTFGDQWFFQENLIDQTVDVSTKKTNQRLDNLKNILTYVGVRFNKSIDFVSISPFLFKYSNMIPGGWNLSKNLFNFIF